MAGAQQVLQGGREDKERMAHKRDEYPPAYVRRIP